MNKKSAFTILEISLVTLIIGFLLAGLVTGKSMINQANIRSVISDLAEINKAVNGIKLQYNSWPGDMNSASYTNSSFSGYGNGNNIIESGSTGCNSPESIIAWNHLYYTGNYSPILSGASGSSVPCINIGMNVPRSKITGGFYYLWNADGNSGSMFGIADGNIIHFGSLSSSDNSVNGSILSASDALSLDTKIDDGIANTGLLLAIDGNDTTTGYCSNAWSSSGSNYNTNTNTLTNIACRLVYLLEN